MTVSAAPLSWSKSQIGALQECQRKYFFQRASIPSSEESSSHPWEDILRYRQLKNRHLWSGSLVHEAVGDVLKTLRQGQPAPSSDHVIGKLQERMRNEFKISLKDEFPKIKLFEHEYRRKIAPEIWQGQWNQVEKALLNFFSSSWFDRLQQMGPECWKAVDEVLGFDVGGIKAYVKIDCGLEVEGRFYLMDWKTSVVRPQDEASLLVGALYAHEVWGADPGSITAVSVSLFDGKSLKAKIDEETLMETFLKIQEEAALLERQLPREGDDPFALPMAASLRTCERCNFQRLCHPQGVGL